MQAVLNAVAFLREHNLNTVQSLGKHLNRTGTRLNDLSRIVRGKERRIRDITALLDADKTLHDLRLVDDEYNGIRWKGAKEKYAAAYVDELEKFKKAQRLLHKFGLTQPLDRKTLRKEKEQLAAEVEASRPELDAVKAELDELKTVRYWVRRVMPDALPSRTSSGDASIHEQMEVAQNGCELEDLLVRTAEQVLPKPSDREKQEQVISAQQRTETL